MHNDPSRAIVETPAGWDPMRQREFKANQLNGCVGTSLVSETDRVRVWTVRLAPGQRLPFHRHVLNYFWTCLVPARARSHFSDGRVLESIEYAAGETKHLQFAKGEFMIHDLENIGDKDLLFTTVEFLDSPNAPLHVPETVRHVPAAA